MKLALFLSVLLLSAAAKAQWVVPEDFAIFNYNGSGIHLTPGVDLPNLYTTVGSNFQQYKWGDNTVRADLYEGKMVGAFVDKKGNDGTRSVEKFGYDIGGNLGSATHCSPGLKTYLGMDHKGLECVTVTSGLCGALKANFRGTSFSGTSAEIKQCSKLFEPLANVQKIIDQDSYKLVAKADRDYIIKNAWNPGKGVSFDFGFWNQFPNKSKAEENLSKDTGGLKAAFDSLATLAEKCAHYYPNYDETTKVNPAEGGSQLHR